MKLPDLTTTDDWLPLEVLSPWQQMVANGQQFEQQLGLRGPFDETRQRLQRLLRSGQYKVLDEALRQPLMVRALTQLWVQQDSHALAALKHSVLDQMVRNHPLGVGRLALMNLITLYFQQFDLLDAFDTDSPEPLHRLLARILKKQLVALAAFDAQVPRLIDTLQKRGAVLLEEKKIVGFISGWGLG